MALESGILFFLVVSLLLYATMGGADFGAGALELLSSRKSNHRRERDLIARAMGPVWEANHVWLIAAVVILFTAWPEVFRLLSVNLHIPITVMLLGIIARGCAFAFRHYDAVHDESERWYSMLFQIGSVITPFFQGVIAGAAVTGALEAREGSFLFVYVTPWIQPFPIVCGATLVCVYAFLAATYIVHEPGAGDLKLRFAARARWAAAFAAFLVALSAALAPRPLAQMAVPAAALFCLYFLKPALYLSSPARGRILAAAAVSILVLAWLATAILISSSSPAGDPAPTPTLLQSLIAFLFGSAAVLPALYFLLRTFKFGVPE